MMSHWNTQDARAELLRAGFVQSPEALEFVVGESRICVQLPSDKLAWFPTTAQGQRLLIKERRVLRLLERYCHFSAPRVLYEDEAGWEVRTFVPGAVRPTGLLERIRGDSKFAHQLGEDFGRILAEQHTCVPPGLLEGWLPRVKIWPRPEDLRRLPEIVQDANLLERIRLALERRAAIRDDHPVLVHADLGLHNVVVDPDTLRVAGIIDYEGAMFGDRHEDFAFLVFQQQEEPVLDGALSAYEPITGMTIDRDRVLLLNAVAAIGFLGFRYGHPPEEPWCGRTLEQDLAWTHEALAIAGL